LEKTIESLSSSASEAEDGWMDGCRRKEGIALRIAACMGHGDGERERE
jgi:hypothetical protein